MSRSTCGYFTYFYFEKWQKNPINHQKAFFSFHEKNSPQKNIDWHTLQVFVASM
jgi:hypothetical protein